MKTLLKSDATYLLPSIVRAEGDSRGPPFSLTFREAKSLFGKWPILLL
jgi:hypothetical protein